MNQLQDMPHFTTGNKRMTNVPVGNGEYISGIRRNENLGKEELIMSGSQDCFKRNAHLA